MVGGLAAAAGERIVASRPYVSVADLARRAGLNRRNLNCLAAAGALQTLAGHRRTAHWISSGIENNPPMKIHATEKIPELAPPSEGEEIAADYQSLGLTLGRHPLALLRGLLSSKRFLSSQDLNQLPHGSRARAAGLVTCRQRPDTASGVVFVTLEDESGCVNVVVWRSLLDCQRRELLGARLLGVEGMIEREGRVVHLIARRLEDHSRLLARLQGRSPGGLRLRSRNFH
jgi:error-prone DNA polymerase